jgi:quercetin dioxygenase-like cupin family protein
MHSNPLDRRSLLLAIAGTAVLPQIKAQTPPTTPTIFEHDLPEVNLKNWAVTVREVNYQPGGTSAAHRHPGITIVYVLEGSVMSRVGNGPEVTYGPGQMFMEGPGELHAVSRNASTTKPAKFIAILLAEKGVPLTKPA